VRAPVDKRDGVVLSELDKQRNGIVDVRRDSQRDSDLLTAADRHTDADSGGHGINLSVVVLRDGHANADAFRHRDLHGGARVAVTAVGARDVGAGLQRGERASRISYIALLLKSRHTMRAWLPYSRPLF
jgi:hypothetical protein